MISKASEKTEAFILCEMTEFKIYLDILCVLVYNRDSKKRREILSRIRKESFP